MTEDLQHKYLINALCEILKQCNVKKYIIASFNKAKCKSITDTGCSTNRLNGNEKDELHFLASEVSKTFHDNLQLYIFTKIEDVAVFFKQNICIFKETFGVLLFLYSVLATRGVDLVKYESDTTEPFIDATYGYGSQSLINLMLTGRAVTYVWDNYQDVGGLRLRGLEKQSQVGFITLLEHLRYCTVGSFYKNPVHPVWILGSDTHLSVLFSDERKLVSPETKSEKARRIFKTFDPDGNNFINVSSLQDVLASLELVSEPEYVDIMRKKLDPENLGIILLCSFMDEFFPVEERSTPDMFPLYHYNGLARSNLKKQVQYHAGSAILLESNLKSYNESDPMLTCLQTKWPSIEVNWFEGVTPSLN
ncbi:ubiquitin carboxyl-terminal hydrolase MINDY-3 homolog isoform X2 [Agrilus planipennis]|nr:ubiquitin carboxyl-terminal hydrolase MINDY-3 homolog isoform X2 [Agrilus planipennis]